MSLFFGVIKRELLIAYRNPADLLNPLIFFVIVISLFPLGISPTEKVLSQIAPGVIWVAALLSTLLSMDILFRSDYDDGSLEQMTLSREPFLFLILGKIVSHWLVTGLPLALLSPLLALMLFMNEAGAWALFFSLLLGTPILSLLGAIGAGLTVGLRKGGLLIAVLILPLFVPVLIIATAMVQAGMQSVDYTGHMLWLGAILAASIGFAPIAASMGVRISLSH
ncbi:heme exporter protein CcmB [Pseudomonadales bacterium]|mgnify:FL=1|nr:heme exporter protein CcmB [Pseudomonadales bacterium]MDB9867114.1 heme exporter protein CcmB [Pseudomonadales bacterium]MDB9879519.1 heme exporter protein CcmB [Pseudomonadales bacterium]MDC1368084.1 heme exporter protein CcmB [Pseudomonadales bacterium]